MLTDEELLREVFVYYKSARELDLAARLAKRIDQLQKLKAKLREINVVLSDALEDSADTLTNDFVYVVEDAK